MYDILQRLANAWRSGETVAMATVVTTFSSAPRLPGSAMLVTSDGEVVGSVSGGCIDGAVYQACMDALETGQAALLQFGVSDDSAFAVGLTCGGIIDVFVETISPQSFPGLDRVERDVSGSTPVAVATVIDHPDRGTVASRVVVRAGSIEGSLGNAQLDHAVRQCALRSLSTAGAGVLETGENGECDADGVRVFISTFAPARRLIIFGANDFAAAMVDQAVLLGYHTTVCDARPLFATTERYPAAHQVAVDWPHRYLKAEIEAGRISRSTALCVLTHDPKFDIPLLRRALRDCPAGYVGAMGSRRTHDRRIEALRDSGLTAGDIGRLSSPIGVDLGAATPQETAVSIAAELILLDRGGSGSRLSQNAGPIHPGRPGRLGQISSLV